MRLRSLAFTVSSFALLLTGLAYSPPAAAQAKGFALDRFDPSERGSEWFVLDTLDMRGKVRPAFGVVGDWGYKPLAVYDKANGDKEVGSIVEHQFFVHVGGSLSLAERIRLGVNLPIAAYQTGDRITSNGRDFTPPDSALGDLRLSADLRLFGRYGGPITAALGASVYLPTGDQDKYTSDGNTRVQPHINVAGDIGIFAYAVKAGFNYRPLDDEFVQGKKLGSELLGGVSAGLRLANKKLLIGPELYGSTVVTDEKSFFKKRTTPAEVMFGLHYTAGDFRFGAGAGTGVFAGSRGWGSPQVRGLVNIEWMPAYNDDSDGDGVPDSEDACPTQPGVKTNDPKTNGCPPDKDGDGVYDKDDACVDVPGVKTSDPKTNGCPPDRDKDGIVDNLDACPDQPGPSDPDPKKNGCPAARIEAGQIKIIQQVKFKTNSATIVESDAILNAVLAVLKEHPEVKKIRVEGHSDNTGKAAYNKTLSQKRAASVAKWLTDHGIDKKRTIAKGWGQEKPIDTNNTEEGRANNRRVEFHIEEVPDAPAKPAKAPKKKK